MLEIPDGALPEGLPAADVGIRPVPVDQVPSGEGVTAVAGYELQPDGLQLSVPAVLEIQLEPYTPFHSSEPRDPHPLR